MIVDLVLELLAGILSTFMDLLPAGDPPFNGSSLGGSIAAALMPINRVVPFMAPLEAILTVVVVTFPALLGYRVGLFLYKRVRG